MKNFIQPGDTIAVAAPYSGGVASGNGVLVGTLFGVAVFAAAQNAMVEIRTEGVFDLPKAASQAWTVGALVYWDNTNRVCTTTASGNTLIGKAVLAVGSGAGETIGRVRLG
jgi:predicted RecA/RadA family phage recombinase